MLDIKKWGIKTKVLVVAVFPAAAVTLLLALYFSITQTQDLEQSLNDRGFAIVRQLAPASEYGMASANAGILQPLAQAVMRETDVRSVAIRNSAGTVLVRVGPPQEAASTLDTSYGVPSTAASDSGTSQIFQAPVQQTELAIDADLERQTHTEAPIERQTTPRVLGWVNVELSLDRTRMRHIQIWRNTGLIAIFVLALSVALALSMGRNITGPILKLKDAVRQMERGNLDANVKTDTGGELLALEAGVNAMARSLKASRENLQERVDQATAELRDALKVLEQKNIALDAARAEAETANKTKAAFVANMSHEIRTPLNGILGFLILLSKTPLTSLQRDHLGKIDISAKTLLTLIGDMLDFSKLEAAAVKLDNVEFDLRELVDTSVQMFVHGADQKGLELVPVIDARIPPQLRGPAARLAQILNNLLSNATKFTASGSVVVEARLIASTPERATIRIEVTDSGIGITPADQQRLFQPFTQLNPDMNRQFGGTGLGLAIVKSLVDLMGGDVDVRSDPGNGSCFAVTLSFDIVRPYDESRAMVLHDRRALVVSSSHHLQRALTEMLQGWGITLVTTADTSAAENAARSNGPPAYDTIVLDVDALAGGARLFVERAQAKNASRISLILLERQPSIAPLETDGIVLAISIHKPPRRSELFDALCRVSGLDRDNAQRATDVVSTLIPVGASLNVLLADDNPINRQFLATWLRQLNATVVEAKDGMEALAACRNQRFDLILMDLHMPNMDGFEAAERIRELQQNQVRTPIIAISADATDAAKQRFQASGLDDYLVKPVTEDALRRLIAHWVFENHRVSATGSDSGAVVDEALGIRLASGDRELWWTAVRALAAQVVQQNAALDEAIAKDAFRDIRELVHRLCGSASYCAAIALRDCARKLEAAVASNDRVGIQQGILDLKHQASALLDWVRQHDDDANKHPPA